ncbi:MAG: glycerol kinase GlpK [Clostridia bacterium]|nr:glycerol kinase GlpK [Clostridia bacterium]
MKYVLSLDQGTTSSRAIIFDKGGNIISSAQREFKQIYPAAGWVEHSPADIYGTTVSVAAEALARASVSADEVCTLGITNQRETTLVWDKRTGEAVCNAIVWQCRRTADLCEKLKEQGYSDLIYEKTGLIPDAYFSATKLKWILDNIPSARQRAERGELLFGTVDTFLMWKLSKGRIFATDYTNAARTMLFNIHTLQWDKELLKLFNIPAQMLPEVKPSGADFGCTDKSVFGFEVPVCSAVGDQQAALFGQLCLNDGDVKNTYGTGCFLLMNTGSRAVKSKSGLITTLGAAIDNAKIGGTKNGKPPYVLEGSVFAGGAAVQWLRDGLKIISSADESQALAQSVNDNGGVYFVPAFTGLGAPYWNSEARGTITGLTRGTTRAHIVRAVLEGIAYQVCDVVQAMEKDANVRICRLAVDGGASKNDFLLQFQADILNCPTERPKVFETTALGAAYLAGLQAGFWTGVDELKRNLSKNAVFNPEMPDGERIKNLGGWRKAVERTLL